jgi:hypothetical protein
MARRAILVLGLLAVTCGPAWSAPSWAQTPTAPQSCSVPPVTNEKLQRNADGKMQNSDGKGNTDRTVVVDRIEFDRPVHLSNSDVEQIVKTANKMEWDTNSSGWVDTLAEIELRGAWQDRGYFEINLAAHARSDGGDSDHERFVVAVHVEKEGPQFHLGTLQFAGGTVVSYADLRQVFPLREGEFFNVGQVRAGIEALTKLYSSKGYIDFTAVPLTNVDENLQRIDLVMQLNEQRQYRVGSLEIQGLDPGLEAGLRSIIVPGEAIKMESITAFFKENRSALPPRALDNLEIRRDVRTGIVDLTFDARTCP